MAKLYGEIASKALLTLDKSFARANGQPLDTSEVYYSLEAAKTYAATAQAYIGQKIVVIENGVVTHYSVQDTAGNLKQLGYTMVPDGTTIEIGQNGKITLANISDKKEGTYNAVLVDGELTWVAPSATTVEGLNDLITALTGRVSTLETKVGSAKTDTEEATGLFKALDEEVARATEAEQALSDKIDAIDYITPDSLTTTLGDYAKSSDVVSKSDYDTDIKALEDEDQAIREIAEEAKTKIDNFLTGEGVADVVDSLMDIKAELDKMADATEVVTALGKKADKTYVDEELAKKQDVIAENTYDTYGSAESAKEHANTVAASAKTEAISEAATAAAALYATKEALNTHVTEASNTYATKAFVGAIPADYTETTVIDYINKKVSETTGDSDETISSVFAQLEEYKTENIPKFEKLEGIEAGAQVNKIESVVTTETAKITATTSGKTVTIDDSALVALVETAQNQANKGVSDAKTAQETANQAQSEVDALEGTVAEIQGVVTGHTSSISDHLSRIIVLEESKTAHEAQYEALHEIVSGHTTQIAKKAEASDLNAAIQRISANEIAIKTLNETTIPALEEELGKKANSKDVYTKTEIDGITGKVEEGKTIVQMISEAKTAATYDDSELRGLIGDNADAIGAIYTPGEGDTAATGILVREIASAKQYADGVVATEKARAEAIEADHEGRISNMETFWAAADDPEGTIDKLAEIVKYIENDKSGALDMAADIEANRTLINGIYTPASMDEDGTSIPASGVLVTEIARVENKVNNNTDAITAINHETTGILATAKGYTDTQIAAIPSATASTLGLVKFDDVTIQKNANNQIYVAKVSTDILEQGTQTLILNGGSATN